MSKNMFRSQERRMLSIQLAKE